MLLTRLQVQSLAKTINKSFPEKTLYSESDVNSLDQLLINMRLNTLEKHSRVLDIDGQAIRVFLPREKHIDFEKSDALGRALDYMRGTWKILQYGGVAPTKETTKRTEVELQFLKLISSFKERIEQAESKEDCIDITRSLCGTLDTLLVHYQLCADKNKAKNAIAFVSDYLWQKDFNNQPMCTVTNMGEKEKLRLQINEPLTFEGSTKLPLQQKLWENLQTKNPKKPKWFEVIAKKTAPSSAKDHWIDQMMKEEADTIKNISPTSMSRYSPNASNAYRCLDVIVANDKAQHIEHYSTHYKTAISEAISTGHTKDRDQIALLNHYQMIFGNLASNLSDYFNKWQGLLPTEGPIDFKILHQTLVSDGLAFTPDARKANRGWGILGTLFGSNVVDTKHKANQRINQFLKKRRIFFNPETGKLLITAKDVIAPDEPFREIKLDIGETNNCINMWNKLSRVRNNDIEQPREMVKKTIQMLERLNISDNDLAEDLATVKSALAGRNSALMKWIGFNNHSWFTRHFDYSDYQRQAMDRLCRALQKGGDGFIADDDLSAEVGSNLSLLIQSSAELKRTTHETYAGALRRSIANASRKLQNIPVVGHIIDWTIRGGLFVVSSIIKVTTEPFKWILSAFMWIANQITGKKTSKFTVGGDLIHMFREDRNTHVKAKYEGIVAELQGQLFGGCMSSADRANEMGECRSAEKLMHNELGCITQFNGSSLSKIRNSYHQMLGTAHKHNAVHLATGTPGTKDNETIGYGLPYVSTAALAVSEENTEQQKLSNMASKLRDFKPKFGELEQTFFSVAAGKQSPEASSELVTDYKL